MDTTIGRTLKGRFTVTALIGEGSMGTVYAGTDASTGSDVAIKILRADVMREPTMLARFRREANAMRRVVHPNAVAILSHGVDSDLVFVVMERVSGVSVRDLLAVQGTLNPERAARIVADVCAALAEAHAHGVVHRDIKPDNIMLAGAGCETVKLIDFGMAKSRGPLSRMDADDAGSRDSMGPIPPELHGGDDEMPDLTSAGSVIGSPGYMAPEQWAGRAVDERTDVYACGVVLYELVTGQLPFEADNAFQIASMQLRTPPEPPHFINPAVPAALAAVILRALLPSPAARYQSAAQMRDCLRALLDEQSIASAFGLEATIPFQIPSVLRQDGLLALERTCHLPDRECLLPDEPEHAQTVIDLVARRSPVEALLRNPTPIIERLTPQPPPSRRSLLAEQIRLLIPLTAAFLALGVILGILLFLPAPR